MSDRVLLGMLTPSSNTALEPLTSAIVAGLPEVSAHFGRFRVRRIALSDDALAQFEIGPMLAAAELLADAKVDVICWNGTSAGWLGLDADRSLCAAITAATGIPATTSTLALQTAMSRLGLDRLGLVTPYTDDVQAAIRRNFAAEGMPVAAERHLGIADNFAFSEVDAATLTGMVDAVMAEASPPAITTFCTNLKAAHLAPQWEARHDTIVLDTVSVVLWDALTRAGVEPARVTGWGRLFGLAG